MAGSTTQDKADMQAEADRRGVSYKDVKRERKRATEAERLESEEHKRETKRLRTYSHDAQEDAVRHTRHQDQVEGEKALASSKPDLADWRKEHSITVKIHNPAAGKIDDTPFFEFADTPFNDRILFAIKRAGFEKPSPIQAQAWPIALQERDLISIAKTGSGKTCGFLLPVFHRHLLENAGRPQQGFAKPVLLVLAPTRELAVQIQDECNKFGRPVGIRSVCCYGGASKGPQIGAMERGVEIVIACPGRLNDLINMRKADLSNIKYLVLDEADRMLDMGFEPQIRSIVDNIPAKRQTLLFSATWPREIQALAHDFLKDPIQINVGEVNALVANKDIKQTIVMCDEDEKFDKLCEILQRLIKDTAAENEGKVAAQPVANAKAHAKVICFVAKKISCHDLSNRLWDDGFAVDSLHGDRPQWERTAVMNAFKSGQLRLLIATDVAARGLDVKDVGVVINYDMPTGTNGVEDYVHRIGRTGRAGNKGEAYTFFTKGDKKTATGLVEILRKAEQVIPPDLESMARPRFHPGRGGGRGYQGGGRSGGRGGRGYMSGGRGYMGGSGGGGFGGRGRGGFGGRGRGGFGGRGRF